MKRMCAWCGREMPPKFGEENRISHGICELCADNIFSDTAIPLQRYLDKLPEPVLVVDGDVSVAFLNKSAEKLTGKTTDAAPRRKGGDVFDCAHSHLPEGCGRTIHCSGCVIRRCVTATYTTGEPQVQVPASLRKLDADGLANLIITTVKSGDTVLLRIDKVGD